MNTALHRIVLAVLCSTALACGGSDSALAPESTTSSSTVATIQPTTTQPTTTQPTTTQPTTTDSSEPVEQDSTTTESTPETTTTETTTTEPLTVVSLDPNGLTLVDRNSGSTALLAFGTPLSATLAGLQAALGPPDAVSVGNSECGNGQASVALWPGTLSIDFDDRDQFLSWTAPPGSPLTTPAGLGLGSTASELLAQQGVVVEESTLGTEFFFESGSLGLGGLLSDDGPTAAVTDLWGGPICAFR